MQRLWALQPPSQWVGRHYIGFFPPPGKQDMFYSVRVCLSFQKNQQKIFLSLQNTPNCGSWVNEFICGGFQFFDLATALLPTPCFGPSLPR